MGQKQPIQILYQDKRILICLKPPGMVSVDQPGGLPDLLRRQLGGKGECLRTIHRLDQPVGGVMVLARSREAARRLSQQVENRSFRKEYLAVLTGIPEQETGALRDLLGYDKRIRRAYVAPERDREVREAILHYRVLDTVPGHALVGVELETGRTHQIRVQFAARGLPLVGDGKYGRPPLAMEGIALWSHRLAFHHPQTGERMSFSAPPPAGEPWSWLAGRKEADGARNHRRRSNMEIRQERREDWDAVYCLVRKAFASAEQSDGNEQDLVSALRESQSFIPELSLVAVDGEQIVGHILFTRVTVGGAQALALAPLSVLPEKQGKGIGLALIREGHRIAGQLGYGYSIVLGHAGYYPKAGYQPASRYGIRAPFHVPDGNFMAVKLSDQAPKVEGVVQYDAAFGIGDSQGK